MAELDAGGISAVLAADSHVNVETGLTAHLGGHFYQLANALLVELGEGVEIGRASCRERV